MRETRAMREDDRISPDVTAGSRVVPDLGDRPGVGEGTARDLGQALSPTAAERAAREPRRATRSDGPMAGRSAGRDETGSQGPWFVGPGSGGRRPYWPTRS